MAADTDDTLPEWSTTEGSNKPAGATTVGTNWDDNLRMVQKVVRGWLATKGADIASATTTDLGAVEGLFHDITGTTAITGFGTVSAGIWKILKFEGALTLTHNATSLILPGAENITTADGDIAAVASEGSGNWRCFLYIPAAINPAKMVSTDESQTLTNKTLTAPVLGGSITGTYTLAGTPTITAPALNGALSGDAIAAQAEMETGTATDSIVSPGRQHFHASAVKAWCDYNGTGTPSYAVDYNFGTITDNGTGDHTLNFTTAMSGANYAVLFGLTGAGAAAAARQAQVVSRTTAGVRVLTGFESSEAIVAEDLASVYVGICGDM